jgi:hypothetical protein
VHTIDFGAFDICLSLKNNVIIAGTVDKTDDDNAAMAVLAEVNNEFIKLYKDILVDWDGNLEPFDKFISILDKMTDKGTASEKRVIVPILKGKVSPMLVRLGQMSQKTFDVAKKCNGKLATKAIADQLGFTLKDVQKALQTLEDMKMLEWKEIGKK